MGRFGTLTPERSTSPPRSSISQAAAALMEEVDTDRQRLVRRVRSEIATGTYESEAKLDIALERLMADL